MTRILVADDEHDICEMIERYAQHEGYETKGVHDGLQALSLCQNEEFDIIIMDIMMPVMDGYTASRKIREIKDTPIIMLSARGEAYDKLYGFDLGVDDYVTKPFSPQELMARIKAILRRSRSNTEKTLIRSAGIEIDVPGRIVYIDHQKAELTAKEFDLLVYFIKNKGIVLTRETILNAVWGYECTGQERTVDWQIKLLRNKMGKYRNMLKTIRGVGYRYDE
ncbi:MAG: response regulator transcription factor [Erysipelotrichaceae bacterium]